MLNWFVNTVGWQRAPVIYVCMAGKKTMFQCLWWYGCVYGAPKRFIVSDHLFLSVPPSLLPSLRLSVCLSIQEEEMPELEIDIDELLELSDVEQRSRLQVSTLQTGCPGRSSAQAPTQCCQLALPIIYSRTQRHPIWQIQSHSYPIWDKILFQ